MGNENSTTDLNEMAIDVHCEDRELLKILAKDEIIIKKSAENTDSQDGHAKHSSNNNLVVMNEKTRKKPFANFKYMLTLASNAIVLSLLVALLLSAMVQAVQISSFGMSYLKFFSVMQMITDTALIATFTTILLLGYLLYRFALKPLNLFSKGLNKYKKAKRPGITLQVFSIIALVLLDLLSVSLILTNAHHFHPLVFILITVLIVALVLSALEVAIKGFLYTQRDAKHNNPESYANQSPVPQSKMLDIKGVHTDKVDNDKRIGKYKIFRKIKKNVPSNRHSNLMAVVLGCLTLAVLSHLIFEVGQHTYKSYSRMLVVPKTTENFSLLAQYLRENYDDLTSFQLLYFNHNYVFVEVERLQYGEGETKVLILKTEDAMY